MSTRPDDFEHVDAFFAADHRACDALWNAVEVAHEAGDDPATLAAFKAFNAAMRRHLDMEEDILFPALGQATGMGEAGPIAVMKHEHGQIRALLDRMGNAAACGDVDDVTDEGDTLLMLIAQHNVKEESILYPMADRALGAEWAALRPKLARY